MIRAQTSKRIGSIVAAVCGGVIIVMGGTANACSVMTFADNGRYVGGDLTTQIAAKAESIQIVRVAARHLVNRTYSEGSWYLNYGDLKVPSDYPEYTDEFVFKLEPVETLKVGRPLPDYLQAGDLRVRGYSPAALPVEIQPTSWATINALPDWLPDRPGDQGFAFIAASDTAGLGGGECARPYILEVGQTLLAFRNSNGTLYPASGGFPLQIDVEFRTQNRARERFSLNMQSLVPINDPEDAFVARLRQALASRPNSTRN
ncbi:hypothetical protein [Brevundimonas sp.]|jgi:hypothetical protein|uniref:hypothetical protein n=1 Tax=Brevundimonas sp. TaxID=1871086 RepID=UPI0037BFC2B1